MRPNNAQVEGGGTFATGIKAAFILAAVLASPVRLVAQVTGSVGSFLVTNYTTNILAGDAGSSGRQAIRTQTIMAYTTDSGTPLTYDFQLQYQLLDASSNAVLILDEKHQTNWVYTVYQTITLPFDIGSPPISVSSITTNNSAPLQPLTRLDPYQNYTPQLQVFSQDHNNPGYMLVETTNAGSFQFFDFTNTVSPDPSPNLLVTLNQVVPARNYAIAGSPGEAGLPVSAVALVQRYDDFTLPPYPTNTTVTLNFQLQDFTTNGIIPLQASQAVFNVSIPSHDSSSPPNPSYLAVATNFLLLPTVQLDSVDDQYQVIVTLTHTEGGTLVLDHTNTLAPTNLLAFNGQLLFGSLLTYFTNLDSPPTVTGTFPQDPLTCLIPVSQDAGSLPSAPGYTYGDGSAIPVSLFADGHASLQSGATVHLHSPSTGTLTIQNISYQLSLLQLTSAGAFGTLNLDLPLGLSVLPQNLQGGTAHQFIRLTTNALVFPNVALNAQLAPTSSSLVPMAAGKPLTMLAIHETLPYWFLVSQFTWLVNAGQLQLALNSFQGGAFVRQQEDNILTMNQSLLVDTNSATRISNDGYYRNGQAAGMVTVTADANGVALLSGQLNLQPPELRPHFPYSGGEPGVQLQTSNGVLVIQNSLVASNSFLGVSNAVPLSYGCDCQDTNCTTSLFGTTNLQFVPPAYRLQFTPDGGLLAYGSNVSQTALSWGYINPMFGYAQEVFPVQQCVYAMAGTFLRYDQSAVVSTQRPAAILLSGFGDSTSAGYVERLSDTNYVYNGFANYAGLNFRVPATGPPTLGQSIIAKTNYGPYQLTPTSKYYVRFGGVSGKHEAASIPVMTPSFYGYDFAFSSYRLSYLDSDVWESRTDGQIMFPASGPAGFTQNFEDMILSCQGDIESAQLPASAPTNQLSYWNVSFVPQSLQFKPPSTNSCDTSQRWLVIGAQMTLPFIPTQALHAALAFWPNGNLATPADNVAGTDSRFQVPAQLFLQGPGTSLFPFSTAAEGYFNNWATPGRPASGFYNLAGRLRVPFFHDVEAHLHIAPVFPTDTSNATVSVMGGWPYPGSQAPDLGWSVNTSNYFNLTPFDPNSDGWPASQQVSLATYETGSPPPPASNPPDQYRARAQQDWLKVAAFDYPLKWDPTLRKFAGFQDAPADLPVLAVNSRLKELSPGKVDFDFAEDLSLQLPRIKALDTLNDAIDYTSGPLLSVKTAFPGFDVTGLNELQHALREDPQSFFGPVLNSVLQPVAVNLCNSFSNYFATNPQATLQDFLNNQLPPAVNLPGPNSLANALQALNNNPAVNVLGQVNQTLSDVTSDVGTLIQILTPASNGQRMVIKNIVNNLLSSQANDLGLAGISSLGDDLLDPLMTNISPTLDDIQSRLQDLNSQFAQVQSSLGGADFSQALGQVLQNSTDPLVTSTISDLQDFYSGSCSNLLTAGTDYFTADPNGAQQVIQRQLLNAFFSSSLPPNYQQTLRQFLFDDNAQLDQLIETLCDELNGLLADGISAAVEQGAAAISGSFNTFDTFQGLKGSAPTGSGGGGNSPIPTTLMSAKIRGSPTFNGDSLRKIHLDAQVQMNLPDQMTFDAFMEIKEIDSQSAPVDCLTQGDQPAAEVTLGAYNVSLNWPGANASGTPLTLAADARWTLRSGNVIGVGGSLDIKGEIGFESVTMKEIGVDMAFGEIENYFAGKAAGTIPVLGIPVDVNVGLFVGKACSLDPLTFIDPHATDVLPGNPNQFAGVYLLAGAGFSLSDLVFHSSSCVLDAEANASVELYYNGASTARDLGMRVNESLDLSLLCLISGSASVSMWGSISPSSQQCYLPGLGTPFADPQLALGASARLCGSLGPCPFCVSGCASMGISATVTPPCMDANGNVTPPSFDYNLDY